MREAVQKVDYSLRYRPSTTRLKECSHFVNMGRSVYYYLLFVISAIFSYYSVVASILYTDNFSLIRIARSLGDLSED